MAQGNFVENVYRADERATQEDVITNSDIIADVAPSPRFASRHVGTTEIKICASYTIRLEGGRKSLYKNGVKCAQLTHPEGIISAIGQARGGSTTSRIGETISENYGIHMSPDRSFQFYKRVFWIEARCLAWFSVAEVVTFTLTSRPPISAKVTMQPLGASIPSGGG